MVRDFRRRFFVSVVLTVPIFFLSPDDTGPSDYNVAAIPLAAGVLYNAGIVISPALGAVLMSASTVIVALNAQLLRRKFHTA